MWLNHHVARNAPTEHRRCTSKAEEAVPGNLSGRPILGAQGAGLDWELMGENGKPISKLKWPGFQVPVSSDLRFPHTKNHLKDVHDPSAKPSWGSYHTQRYQRTEAVMCPLD